MDVSEFLIKDFSLDLCLETKGTKDSEKLFKKKK